eukprot:SAG25_NODE_620_length_6411_cov_11.541350_9_plen_87_part_00
MSSAYTRGDGTGTGQLDATARHGLSKGEAGKTPRRHQDDPGRHQAPPRRGGACDHSGTTGGHIAIIRTKCTLMHVIESRQLQGDSQ